MRRSCPKLCCEFHALHPLGGLCPSLRLKLTGEGVTVALHRRSEVFLWLGGCPAWEPDSCLENLEGEKWLVTFVAEQGDLLMY